MFDKLKKISHVYQYEIFFYIKTIIKLNMLVKKYFVTPDSQIQTPKPKFFLNFLM